MPFDIKRAATRHSEVAHSQILMSDLALDIVIRATRPTTGGASLFGDLTETPAEEDYDTIESVQCLWYNAKTLPTVGSTSPMQIAGMYPDAEALVTVWLEDVLVDDSDIYGETYFDIATNIVHGGQKYKVIAGERRGMSNVSPYLYTAILAGEVRNRS